MPGNENHVEPPACACRRQYVAGAVRCTDRKPYERPQMLRVPLRPHEAVLTACKTATMNGAFEPFCNSGFNCVDLTS